MQCLMWHTTRFDRTRSTGSLGATLPQPSNCGNTGDAPESTHTSAGGFTGGVADIRTRHEGDHIAFVTGQRHTGVLGAKASETCI